jgi:hypothetical protein
VYIPAEIWKMDAEQVSKVFFTKKEVKELQLDPQLQTADIDRSDNYWPQRTPQSRFELFKYNRGGEPNPMQKAKQ